MGKATRDAYGETLKRLGRSILFSYGNNKE